MRKTCALCKLNTDLKESHFIPAALYRLISKENIKDGFSPDHISVSPAGTMQTSRQITCKLLCGNCEQQFSERGEKIIINECFRGESNFLLREKLRRQTPTWSDQSRSLFAATSMQHINVDAYRYFAASIFWRGSSGHWTAPGHNEWRGSLGLRYEEEFRRFLLDEIPFPQQALLAFFIANEEKPLGYSSVTSKHRNHGFHTHKFHIPGIEVRMFLGSKIDRNISFLFDEWSTNSIFFLEDSRANGSFAQIVNMAHTTPVRGKLRERTLL